MGRHKAEKDRIRGVLTRSTAPAPLPSDSEPSASPDEIQFVPLDDRNTVITELSSVVESKMQENRLQLPPGWASVRELTNHIWQTEDPGTPLAHIIDLQNELQRPDYQTGLLWRGFVDEVKVISLGNPFS